MQPVADGSKFFYMPLIFFTQKATKRNRLFGKYMERGLLIYKGSHKMR